MGFVAFTGDKTLTLDLIRKPTASMITVTNALALHARDNPCDAFIVTNELVQPQYGASSLAYHLEGHGLEQDREVQEDGPPLQVQEIQAHKVIELKLGTA